MSDLIDRQPTQNNDSNTLEALDCVSRQAAIEAVGYYSLHSGDKLLFADKALKSLPSAQPEIIRCGECKYWDTTWQNDWTPNYHYCPNVDGTRRNDFYCADAERRADETD